MNGRNEHDNISTFTTGYFQKEMTFQYNAVDLWAEGMPSLLHRC